MKFSAVFSFLAVIACAHAHYECTTEQAFDVLFSNATTDALAQQLLKSLQRGVVTVEQELSEMDADKAARDVLTRYRAILSTLALAHQGCNVEAAFNRLLGEATIEHFSEAMLQSLQHDVSKTLERIENASPDQIADRLIDRYRVLRGLLAYAGIKLPLF
ncbi:hypothetical protein IWW36_001986 [Coemansia brasiliensis]|uniref:Secreted protein n=1 Tax=Coemansia brasiliensis TaxID=2650707 RepID=A0A9W8LYK2_9FUNG|nr:hypothetical protein IWW36_001986 [Coemansia brasiliensis]